MVKHSEGVSGVFRTCPGFEISERCGSGIPLGHIGQGGIPNLMDRDFLFPWTVPAGKNPD